MISQQTRFREWLAWSCVGFFVSLCHALGLHPTAQTEMLARMANWVAMVDTHLVLSFLCEAERDHESVRKILGAWARLNRRIATCDVVLEEAAYHAYAAHRDFTKMFDSGELKGISENPDSIRNAYIRGFLKKSEGQLGYTRWKRFIFNYQGNDRYDGSKLRDILSARGWDICDTWDIADEEHQRLMQCHPQAAMFSSDHIASSESTDNSKRKEWDVRLVYGCLLEAQNVSNKGGSVVIMSRSAAVAEIVKKSGAEDGGVSLVSVSSLGYAMALTPGLSISLPDIQDLLLEEGLLRRAAFGLEKAAKRVADREISEGFDLAEAPMLETEFRNAVSNAIRFSNIY